MINECLICNSIINEVLNINFIFSFKTYQNIYICKLCRNDFIKITGNKCKNCCKKGDFESKICLECKRWSTLYNFKLENYSIYEYNEKMQDFFQKYKFNGDFKLRKVFQNDLVNYLNNKSEILVPIPVSEKAMESRGFNQVIGLIENIEYCECLKALNNKKNQSKKNRKERLQTKQPFSIISDQIKLVEGKEVILIDDIYTTGVTLRHATNLLLHNGVKKVRSLTLAR